MSGRKVPVTVSEDTSARLEALMRAAKQSVTPTAVRAIDRSTICHLAIQDLLERYGEDVPSLVARLGFSSQPSK